LAECNYVLFTVIAMVSTCNICNNDTVK